jgi:hypothetical protein
MGAAPTHRPQARPAHPADIAQARLFDAVLLGEIAELATLVASMEKRWLR